MEKFLLSTSHGSIENGRCWRGTLSSREPFTTAPRLLMDEWKQYDKRDRPIFIKYGKLPTIAVPVRMVFASQWRGEKGDAKTTNLYQT